MMFLRHGMFARKSAVERHRKLIIGGAIGLLLVATAVIYAVVKAAGSYNLGYTDASNKGLTSGNISGVLSKTDTSAATNVDRDGQIKLTLEFDFTDDVVEQAKTATAWTYDLNSAVGGSSANPFVASVADITTPYPIVNNGVTIAKYTVQNNIVTVVPESTTEAAAWWLDHSTNVKVGLSVTLNLDKVSVGTNSQDTFVLPGTQTDTNPSGNSTNAVVYDTPHVTIHEYVFDESAQNFKTGDYDKLIDVEKVGSDYIATYNTNFYTDVYASDLKVKLELSGDQTFDTSAGLVMKTCTTNNCIHDASATTIAIPSNYITYSNGNKTAEIDMEGFLYDYCEVGGHDCTAAGIYGYTLNDPMNANNANSSDYYIQYKANLGSTDPAGSGKTYSSTATITGNNNALVATDTVRYGVGIPGSKTGTCVSGSTTDNGVTTCNEDGNGDIFIDYVIKVGEAGTDLSKTTITDKITDNQVLEGDITLTSPSGATTTIAKTTSCPNDSDNDCIVSAAIDTNYSTNAQKLFSHAFGAGDVGEWTVSYRVKIAKDAVIGGTSVDNKIDLTLDQTTYNDVWKTSTHYEFARPMYIEKVEDYTRAADGTAHWTITVYGPTTGSLSNVAVTDTLWYDAGQYTTGIIATTVDTATKTVNNVTTTVVSGTDYNTSIVNGNLVINIPTLNAGEVYTFGIVTQADNDFKTAYAGKSVALQNQACRSVQIDGNTDNRCSEQVRTTILTPNAETMTKKGVEDGQIFYWNMDQGNNKYVYGTRKGYVWTATINPNAGAILDTTGRANDYEPYFTDIIPAGMYLTYRYDAHGKAEPACQTAGACDASTDIDQSKYYTSIEVKREIPSLSGQKSDYKQIVDVEVIDGVIQPINLADVFNVEGCQIPSGANPTLDCAGINGVIYTVTYATTLADDVYNDYANAYTFTNQAKLYEETSTNVFTERANAADTVTYRNSSAIEKSDPTAQTLEATSKITYAITVNKAGYAYLNNGEPYGAGDTRPLLTVTDQIPSDVSILTTAFSATNLDSSNPANNSLSSSDPIICTDINNTIVNDCSFTYDSETRILTAQVPDGLVRKIWYSVIVANPIPNKSSDYSNTAVLHTTNTDFSSTATRNHTIDGNVGYISGNGTMKIKKVNADNLSETVSGAKFKLVQVAYDASTGALGAETEIDLNGSAEGNEGTTNNSGVIEFQSLCGYSTNVNNSCPSGGQLYYWQEVSAPAPYIPTSGTTKHYFMLYDEETSASGTQANSVVAQTAANLIEENGSNHFTIEVLKSNYEWVVTNIKQEETSIAIEKQITGNTARVEDEFTIQISATNLAGEPLNGQFDIYYYNQSNPDQSESWAGKIEFIDGTASVNHIGHSMGIVIDGLYVGGIYEITEADNDYTVSYTCTDIDSETGCTSATSNTGVFVADMGGDPYVSRVGQKVVLSNDSSTEITGISDKKPSIAIAVVFGSTVSVLGIVIARKFRH